MTLAILAAALLAIPAFVFTVECLAGLKSLRPMRYSDAPPFAVLMPAHDEALGITKAVAAVRVQLRPQDRILVIADNCSDDTAKLAKLAGASVVERWDTARLGKGFALAFGRETLMAEPPAVAIVIDADCCPNPGALEALAAHAGSRDAAVQGLYLMEHAESSSPLVAISNFAFLVKNLIRQRAMHRLGGPALLQGTGMAFPWKLLVTAPLATDNLVEDISLGLALASQGNKIEFTEAAVVRSFPAGVTATIEQRTRWEHGFIASASLNIPRLVREAFVQRRVDLLLQAVDLLVPPLALLIIILATADAAAAALAYVTGSIIPLLILTSALAAVALAVVLAWVVEGRSVMPFSTLLKTPIYVVWKLPIYARLFGNRQKAWVRTERK